MAIGIRAGVVATMLAALLACGSDQPAGDPAEVLASARTALVKTSGVHITVTCDDLPDDVSGLVGADGTLTSAPAFDGTVQLRYGGITADLPVISVDGTVWARLPFTTDYAVIDPAEYDAPDPALLLAPSSGLPRWLAEASEVHGGDPVRDGHDVLTPYYGSLPGPVVAAVIPGADDGATFAVTFTITHDGLLHEAEVTGPFYQGEQDVTYVVGVDDYGTADAVTAP
jgi:lipoprotein LprG